MKTILILISIAIFATGCASKFPRPKANAYLASAGRVDYIREGFKSVRLGMSPQEVIDKVGHPFKVYPWYEPVGIFDRGPKLGKTYIYWMKVNSYLPISNPKEDRWLEFHFGNDSRLKRIKGNVDGNYFDAQNKTDLSTASRAVVKF